MMTRGGIWLEEAKRRRVKDKTSGLENKMDGWVRLSLRE